MNDTKQNPPLKRRGRKRTVGDPFRYVLPIAPTGVGVGIFFLALMIGAAALNTGTNLLYLMFSMLVAATLLSFVFGFRNMASLDVERRVPSEVHAEQRFAWEIKVSNGKRWLSTYGISLFEDTRSIRSSPFFVNLVALKPRSSKCVSELAAFESRGNVELESVLLSSSFPLGFFEIRRKKKLEGSMLVLPRLVDLRAHFHQILPNPGIRESHAKGHGVSLFSIRDYDPGDAARTIHWKLAAKGQGLKVREYERDAMKVATVVLDVRVPVSPTPAQEDDFEKAVSVTASLVRHFIADEFEVGFQSLGGSIERGTGDYHSKAIMRILALLDIEDFKQTPKLESVDNTGAQVRVAFRRGAMASHIQQASGSASEASAVFFDPASVEFPPLGETVRDAI